VDNKVWQPLLRSLSLW